MCKVSMKLTVYFEEPFWIGVFEQVYESQLSACKVTFGKEPTDAEIEVFILKQFRHLKFSSGIEITEKKTKVNPKRKQRNAKKEMQQTGIGTKSQQALAKQREEMKTELKQKHQKQRTIDKDYQFALKQKKRKEKHRGH